MKNKFKKYFYYSICFTLICLIIYSPFYLNNRSLIWNTDSLIQHYVIFNDYISCIKSFLINGSISTFFWKIGLGADIIQQYSYYIIGDLFAYLGVFFGKSSFEYVFSFLIILRIYVCGISMLYFCSHKKYGNLPSVLAAITYAFSGFVLYASIRHPYFINAAILLPLLLVGIDKLLQENKKAFLTGIVFLTVLSSFYFCYMIVIIGLIYAFFSYIFEREDKSIKDFLITVLKGVFCFIVGAMMASVILLPTVQNYLLMDKSMRNDMRFILYPFNYYKYLVGAFTSGNVAYYWVTIGVGALAVGLVSILLKRLKDNKVIISSLVVMSIMLVFPFFGSMMNGFSFPSNRWTFGYIFMLSWMIAKVLNDGFNLSKKELQMMLFTFVIYFEIYFLFRIKTFEFLAEFGLAMAIMGGFYYYHKTSNKKVIYGLLLLVCLNFGFNGLYLYSNKGYKYAREFLHYGEVDEIQKSGAGLFANFDKILDDIKKDEDFYRINTLPLVLKNYNSSIVHDYFSNDAELSLLNGTSNRLSGELNNNSRGVSSAIRNFDERTIVNNVLGVKYYIVNEKAKDKVPYGYSEYLSYDEVTVYKNDYYLTPFIFYDGYITDKNYNNLTPLEKENSLIQVGNIEDEDVLDDVKVDEKKVDTSAVKKLNCSISITGKNNHYKYEQKDDVISIKCENVKNSEVYLSFKNLDIVNKSSQYNIEAVLNDEHSSSYTAFDKKYSAYYFQYDPLMNLGYVLDDGINIDLKFTTMGDYVFDDLEVYAVSFNEYAKRISNLNDTKFEIEKFDNGYIRGKIHNDENGILQLATDYSKGWQVYVDGQKVDTFIVNHGFLGIALEKGEHTIEYKYETPLLKWGLILSIFGFIFFAVINLSEKKMKHRKI